jgi:hypothetical protein
MVRGGFHIHCLLRKRIGQLVENSVMEIIDGHTVEVKYDLSLQPQSRTQRRTSHPSHSLPFPLAQTVVNISLGHRWEEPNPSVISWGSTPTFKRGRDSRNKTYRILLKAWMPSIARSRGRRSRARMPSSSSDRPVKIQTIQPVNRHVKVTVN